MREHFPMQWRDATLQALHRYSLRHSSKRIIRIVFLQEELDQISKDTHSVGQTPGQTVSRILQDLREENLLVFLDNRGEYLLTDLPLSIETEDLSNDEIMVAIEQQKLSFGNLVVGDSVVLARQRRGQNMIRKLSLEYYGGKCAFCDVAQDDLLVAAHISRWADDAQNRGNLHNVICMCRLHDPLFEQGYFAMGENGQILAKSVESETVKIILSCHTKFHEPAKFPPSAHLLELHRKRAGIH